MMATMMLTAMTMTIKGGDDDADDGGADDGDGVTCDGMDNVTSMK